MELSEIELNLSILKWNPGHLDGIYANLCENLHHVSRIYYITFLEGKASVTKINGVKLTKQTLVYRLLTIPTEHGIVSNRYETKAQN